MVAFDPHLPSFSSGGVTPGQQALAPTRPGGPTDRPDRHAGDRSHGPSAMVSIDESNIRVAQSAHLYQTQASASLARGISGEAMAAIADMVALADRASADDLSAGQREAFQGILDGQRARLDVEVAQAEFGGVNLLTEGRFVRTVTNLSGLSFEVRGHALDSRSLGLDALDLSTPQGAKAAGQAARRAETIVSETVALFESEADVARLQRESIREMAITLDDGLAGRVDHAVGESEARDLAGQTAGLLGASGDPIFSHSMDAIDILDEAAA
jgi:hypothetical protein